MDNLESLDRRALIDVAIAELGGDYNQHRYVKADMLIREIRRARAKAEYAPEGEPVEAKAKTAAPKAPAADDAPVKVAPMPELDPVSALVWNAIESRVNAAASQFKPSLDDETIAAMVKDTIADYVARTVTVKVEIPERETITVEGAHFQFPKLLWYVGQRRNVYLWGAPGGGKTTAAKMVAEALALPFYYLAFSPATTEGRITGTPTITGEITCTLFETWYTTGGVMLLDEFDNCNPNLAVLFNGALENGRASFLSGIKERHPDAVCIAAANTKGKGGTKNHASRMALDTATLKRFAVIEWQYDTDQEFALCQRVNGDVKQVHGLLSWVSNVRTYCKSNYPQAVISPRESLNCAKALAAGWPFSMAELARENVLPDVDDDSFNTIMTACPMPALVKAAA